MPEQKIGTHAKFANKLNAINQELPLFYGSVVPEWMMDRMQHNTFMCFFDFAAVVDLSERDSVDKKFIIKRILEVIHPTVERLENELIKIENQST